MHLIDAQFCRRAETVFYGAQNTVHIVLIPLELDDSINDMFKDFWSCKSTFFGNMANQNNGHTTCLCKSEQRGCTLSDLSDGTCRGLDILSHNGLNGIDDYQFGLLVFNVVKDMFK